MNRTRHFRTALALVLPLTAALAVACDNKSSGGSTPATPTATSSAAPTTSASAAIDASAAADMDASAAQAKMDRRFGFAGMLFAAADDMDLSDDQDKKVAALEDALDDKDPAWKEEMKTMHADLLAGIRAGKIDTAKMAPHFAAIDKATQTRQDKEATALNGLWAVLDATQRKALVASIRTKQAEREAKWAAKDGGMGMGMGHGAAMGDGGAADFGKRRVERMTKELDLDDAQQKSVTAIVAKSPMPTAKDMEAHKADGKKRVDALLTAFDSAAFDAKKLELGEPSKKAHEMFDKQVQFFGQLLPILKPEQREKLAAKMERGHGDGSRGHGRGMHGPEQGYNGFPFEEAVDH
jgi:Spy/CpxP family protein refolding chaperone